MKHFYFKIVIAIVVVFLLSATNISNAQVTLNADGPGNTYELINSVLAPGYEAVEAPDIAHPGFGRHIAEVFDSTLNKYVFEFYSHLANDNDPSSPSATDRQRVEIKAYEQSPDNLKAVIGETVTYKFRFKIENGFQPSANFTHIHQLKPIGGDESSPLFSITLRKGTPNKLEVDYVAVSPTPTTKVATADLSLFEGTWVEVTETIKVGAAGSYFISIKRVSDGAVLLTYVNGNMMTIRPDNTFIRPKWGIYRSLATPADLRDETVRFSDFSVAEGAVPLAAITYYWVGGLGPTTITNNSNWNTQLDGNGDSRSIAGPLATDVLIFDGTNVNGDTLTTGTVTTTASSTTPAVAQLKLQNGANIIITRTSAGGAIVPVTGDATTEDDFTISANSTLTLGGTAYNYDVNMPLGTVSNAATGLVKGALYLSPLSTTCHTRSYITTANNSRLVFANGSSCYITDSTATSGFYQSDTNSITFQSGSSLYYYSGRSPFGSSSTIQFTNFEKGSNCYMMNSNVSYVDGVTAYTSSSWSNLKQFANLYIKNGATFKSDGPFFKIDNLTIDNGCTLTTHTSGNTPVLGNLTVNGTLNAPVGSSNTFVMGGNTPQSITGTGAIILPSFTVANYSDVTLSKTITVANICNIVGKLNFGTNGLITGTSSFTSRVAGTALDIIGNTTAGSYQISGVVGALSGNTGLIVKGPGLDANTNVVGFATSNGFLYLSKPALSTTIGSTYTFSSDSATLITAHPNGMDTLNGCIIVTGAKSFQSHTNYIINGATNWPFGISSTAGVYQSLGNVTINANVTTNYNYYIVNTLQVNAGSFNIRPADTVRIISGLGGRLASNPGIFDQTKYSLVNSKINALTGNKTGKHQIINTEQISETNNGHLKTPLQPGKIEKNILKGEQENGVSKNKILSLHKYSIITAEMKDILQQKNSL